MNDINKETHFQYSDYTLPRFTPFCATPQSDVTKDCVAKWSSQSLTVAANNPIGCLQEYDCSMLFPYICKIKNPACDEHTLLFKDYLVALLSDVSQTGAVCSGSCDSGLATFFKPKPKTPKIERIITRKTIKGKIGSGLRRTRKFGPRKNLLGLNLYKN